MIKKLPPIIILAGGLATRLRPITQKMPKAMIEVAGKPFIEHQLKLLREKGIDRVVLCVQYLSNEIEDFVGNGKNFGIDVIYSYDGEKFLGTGGAVLNALKYVEDDFFVLYGDSYLDINYSDVYNSYNQRPEGGLMTIIKNGDNWDKSNIIYKNNKIVEYDKNKKSPDMEYIDFGLGILTKKILNSFDNLDEFDLSIVYQKLIHNSDLAGYVADRRFYEIGSFDGIKDTENYIINRKGE